MHCKCLFSRQPEQIEKNLSPLSKIQDLKFLRQKQAKKKKVKPKLKVTPITDSAALETSTDRTQNAGKYFFLAPAERNLTRTLGTFLFKI